jgi:hypothetical protein
MEFVSLIPGVLYGGSVRNSLLPILPLVALALMGNSCEFRAGVSNPPPSEEAERPRDSDGGLIIAVSTGDGIVPPDTIVASNATSTDPLVARALSMSMLASPTFAPSDADVMTAAAVAEDWLPSSISSGDVGREERPAGAIPEPGAALLFACGVCVISTGLRRR